MRSSQREPEGFSVGSDEKIKECFGLKLEEQAWNCKEKKKLFHLFFVQGMKLSIFSINELKSFKLQMLFSRSSKTTNIKEFC